MHSPVTDKYRLLLLLEMWLTREFMSNEPDSIHLQAENATVNHISQHKEGIVQKMAP